jgi:hypothetical protein
MLGREESSVCALRHIVALLLKVAIGSSTQVFFFNLSSKKHTKKSDSDYALSSMVLKCMALLSRRIIMNSRCLIRRDGVGASVAEMRSGGTSDREGYGRAASERLGYLTRQASKTAATPGFAEEGNIEAFVRYAVIPAIFISIT